MNTEPKNWSKTELKVYILLLCAKADAFETDEEITLIKTKIDPDTFNRIYQEFCADDEEKCLEKIQTAIGKHEYSNSELIQLKKEIKQVFLSDKAMQMKEHSLERILDNLLY